MSDQPLDNFGNKPLDPTPAPDYSTNPYQSQVTNKTADIDALYEECAKVIIGQSETIELIITCILADGHILLEGVPGVAKTLIAKTIAKTIDADFSRIQFTPDLMPTDIIGTSIYNMKDSNFEFKAGPIFSNFVLIDEINRAPAKTQSALFEVMEEKQISYDSQTYKMGFPFVVIATQNPVEQEGTYVLPEAQLDRFLMKINLTYPTPKEELNILNRYKNNIGPADITMVQKILNEEKIKSLQASIGEVFIKDDIMQYIVDVIQETRNHSKVYLGASPRASLALLKTSKVTALLAGRNFVIPDDIQYVAPHVLNHRIILTPDAEMEGVDSFAVIKQILQSLEVPR